MSEKGVCDYCHYFLWEIDRYPCSKCERNYKVKDFYLEREGEREREGEK